MLGQVALLVAEDPQLRRILRVTLNETGARLLECRRARDAVDAIETHRPDILLVDLSPRSLEPVRTTLLLREHSDAPIIAFSEERLKIAIFDAGADDYLTIPFSNGEMLARIRAALRRSVRLRVRKPRDTFRAGALEVDFVAREVRLRGKSIHLTPTEYKLLGVLIESAGKVVTHETLLHEVWGADSVDQVQYLRVYMKQLRRKLELAPTSPQYLITEPAVGYKLRLPA